MKLSEFQTAGEADLTIDRERLDKTAGEVPYKISKWLKYLTTEKLRLIIEQDAYQKLYKERYEHYMLKYDFKLTKDDTIKIYLPADDALTKLDNVRQFTIEKMKYIESVIKTLNQMTFTIKNMIEWQKFQQGR
jgi:hypothetical protein